MPSPNFSSHIELAHEYWKQLLKPGETAIDATIGNGKDTLQLANLVLHENQGLVIGMDIQQQAIDQTNRLLKDHFSIAQRERIHLFRQSHADFPKIAKDNTVKLIVYNLGYLPGGDKTVTTLTMTTLISFERAQELICDNGAISITCYPGHLEGQQEQKALLDSVAMLDPKKWIVCYHQWVNRPLSPTLLWIQKKS